ncbi:hypothetical protein ACO3VM_00850 [Methanocaldococcus sp. 10A]
MYEKIISIIESEAKIYAADSTGFSPYLKKLLKKITNILCVLVDKGYTSRKNAQL